MNPFSICLLLAMQMNALTLPSGAAPDTLPVVRTVDFSVTGKGEHAAWQNASWVSLNKLDVGGPENKSRFKIMYSEKGIYVYLEGDDQRITTKYDTDFDDLYLGDVFEVFFHPDPKLPLYFEYEVNALDKELVLLIPNLNGAIKGWLPWKYEGNNKVQKKVVVQGGTPVMNGTISAWSAELFFPYSLLQPLIKGAPKKGTVWNANFYRLDYDTGKMIRWAWSPVERNFHEYKRYGSIRFE